MKDKVHRISAKALVVKNDCLLVIKKDTGTGPFYLLPGGGQDHGEILSDTIVREVKEETGYEVIVGDVVFVRDYIGKNHEFAATSSHFHQLELYFNCTLKNEMQSKASLEDTGQIGIEWLPLSQVETLEVYPLTLRKQIREGQSHKIYLGDVN